jgi:LDH2 family malate/lactate/ureidoglycolate dehydrogenase
MSDSYSHGNGTVLIAMDPEFFFGTDQFMQDVNQATEVIKNAPPADPNKPVLLPGEVEELERAKNSDGIVISAAIWGSILELENRLLSNH